MARSFLGKRTSVTAYVSAKNVIFLPRPLKGMRINTDVSIWKAGVHCASRTVRYGLRFPQHQAEVIADLE